jgi:hypothetical protein
MLILKAKGTAYHSNGGLLSVIAHNQINLADIQPLLSNRGCNQYIELSGFEFLYDLRVKTSAKSEGDSDRS